MTDGPSPRPGRQVPWIIAVDGPAASGKGTLARRLAAHYDFAYLDTGALYRAVALTTIEAGGAIERPEDAVKAAENLNMARLEDKDFAANLRRAETGLAASVVAAMAPVRAAILAAQRQFAAMPPGDKAGRGARRPRYWHRGVPRCGSQIIHHGACRNPR